MGKRVKASEKYKIIKQVLKGEISERYAAEILGVNKSSIQDWIRLYETEGISAFTEGGKKRTYSIETKLAAVGEYLAGKGSLRLICRKYRIRSKKQLSDWIKVYNAHGDLNTKISGGSYMRTTRKTTQEERLKIAKECLESGKDYGRMAIKYQVSYQQVRTWTLRYEEMGEAGLEDRRGKRKRNQEPRTELEKAQIEIEQLKRALYMAEMERDLLKKLDEVERREASHK